MKQFSFFLSRTLGPIAVSSITLLLLAGCSGLGTASFPDAAVNPAQVPVGSIQGSVYGGHAPLIGAHVYLLSPGTSGYGSQASSLLCDSGTANASCTTSLSLNASDPNIPTSWYYETTDSTGAFNLTGNYTCTAGNPVYIYAYGGSPTYPSSSNVFTVSQVVVAGGTTVTMTVTTTENAYIGESFTIAPGSLTAVTALNGTTQTVIAGSSARGTNLTTRQFSFTSSTTLTNGTYPQTGSGQVTFSPTNNPAVVNLATLGVCPSTGSLAAGGTLFNGTTSGAIRYIYMNEVSTAATAYAFEGFTPATVTATTNATDIGTSSTNLIGIQNAALKAALLYDINGSQITTAYAGEGHIANPKTPAGNAAFPRTSSIPWATSSPPASTPTTPPRRPPRSARPSSIPLPANGVPVGGTGTAGIVPLDTAQAMFNIVHYPAGDPNNTATFMANLYGLPSGNVPFTPNLVSTGAGQPNDFTLAIQYPKTFTANAKITSAATLSANAAANGPESIAIDSFGNVWLNDASTPYAIFELNPQGTLTFTSPTYTYAAATSPSTPATTSTPAATTPGR